MTRQKQQKENWGSRLGVVLAVAGSAVGLGNFLRFPGQVVNYGGGAFMIPYLISLLVVAIPLAFSEWALGRCGGRLGFHSPLGIYYAVGGRKKLWGMCGGVSALAPFVINMYYIFIEAWCLLYALQYLGGCLESVGLGFSLFAHSAPGLNFPDSQGYSDFFNAFVGIEEDGALFKGSFLVVGATLLCAVANFALIYCGISKGIERFCKFAAPLILICSLAVIVRVLTLGNPTGVPGQSMLDALGFMWNPTRDVTLPSGELVHIGFWQTLCNPESWLAATSQIFFTASLCLGAIATYSSYVKENEDIALSSLTATATNEFCEVILGGLMVIPPAIMYLGMQAADKFGSSFSMGFVVLPNVFGEMPAGQFFGFVFFILLFFAAITSSMSLVQPTVALLQETFRWTRGRCVIVGGLVNLTGTTLVCWFTRGLAALDVFDFWFANFGPFLFAVVQTFLVSYIWGLANFRKELDRGAKIRVPRWIGAVVKYVSLPYLILIFLLWCWNYLGARIKGVAEQPVAQLVLTFLGILAVLLLTLSFIVIRRWRSESEESVLKEERVLSVNDPLEKYRSLIVEEMETER